jgi:hypothetical protein
MSDIETLATRGVENITSPHTTIVTGPEKYEAAMKRDIDMNNSVTWKRTYWSHWNEEYTFPEDVKIVQVDMTWGWGEDERHRVPGSVFLRNAKTNTLWTPYHRTVYIRVTGGRKYRFLVGVDGYKGRDYGWILRWSTSINSHSADIDDRNGWIE